MIPKKPYVKGEEFCREIDKVYSQLGAGEKESIALSIREGEKTVLIDEKLARKVCKLYGIRPLGTLRVLLESFKKGFLEEDELRKVFKIIVMENSGNCVISIPNSPDREFGTKDDNINQILCNSEFRLSGEVIVKNINN